MLQPRKNTGVFYTPTPPYRPPLSNGTFLDLSLSKVAVLQKLHGGRNRSSRKFFSCSKASATSNFLDFC